MSLRRRKKEMGNIITGVDPNKIVQTCKADIDDGGIAAGKTTLVIINLNYVWDAVGETWVKMTQP